MRECRAAASWALAAERRAEFAVEGRIEILRHPNLGVAGPARLIFAAARDEPHQRLACAGDNDLLATERLVDKARQVGLCLVKIDLAHGRLRLDQPSLVYGSE